MAGMTVGAGLAALGFWIFIAAITVTAIWVGARKRDAQHETLRRMIEGGQPIDPQLVNALLSQGGRRLERDLQAAGLVALFTAPGVAVLGWFIGQGSPQWLFPMLGVAVLIGCVGLGLLVASIVAGRRHRDDDGSAAKPGRHQIGFGGV